MGENNTLSCGGEGEGGGGAEGESKPFIQRFVFGFFSLSFFDEGDLPPLGGRPSRRGPRLQTF